MIVETSNRAYVANPAAAQLPKSPKTQAFEGVVMYYGYRFYDPETGRWPSRDPIEEMGGVNLYGFVGNDGVNRWDLLGMLLDPPCKCAEDLGNFKSVNFTLTTTTMIQSYQLKDPKQTITNYLKAELEKLMDEEVDRIAANSVWVDIKNKFKGVTSTIDKYSAILGVTHEIASGFTITDITMNVEFQLCKKDEKGDIKYVEENGFGNWMDTGLSLAEDYQRKQLPDKYVDVMLQAATDIATKIKKAKE